jgi:3-oxoacyl-[acyl-carrier-protein] synthase-1
MKPVLLAAMTATSALGRGLAATLAALREGRSALAPCHFETVRLEMHIG